MATLFTTTCVMVVSKYKNAQSYIWPFLNKFDYNCTVARRRCMYLFIPDNTLLYMCIVYIERKKNSTKIQSLAYILSILCCVLCEPLSQYIKWLYTICIVYTAYKTSNNKLVQFDPSFSRKCNFHMQHSIYTSIYTCLTNTKWLSRLKAFFIRIWFIHKIYMRH